MQFMPSSDTDYGQTTTDETLTQIKNPKTRRQTWARNGSHDSFFGAFKHNIWRLN